MKNKKKLVTKLILLSILMTCNIYLIADVTEEEVIVETIEGGDGRSGWKKKTVGCGSYAFEDWQPYCCRGWNITCTAYTCDGPVYGCD